MVNMLTPQVDMVITVPQDLWEAVRRRAQSEHEDENTLLIRAIKRFLQQTTAEQLARECAELAELKFADVGTEDEWLVLQNEVASTH